MNNQSSSAANGDAFQAIAQGAVTTASTSATSAAIKTLGSNTYMVRVAVTKATYVHIADTATDASSSNGSLLTDGSIDYFSVRPGQFISAIRESEDGTINITEGL